MIFKINSKQLFSKLQVCGKAIASKSVLPILDCFKLRVKSGWLYITAFDQETRISSTIQLVESSGDIEVAIDASTILNSLKMLPEQPIEIEVNENNLEVIIKYHNGQYSFIGLDAKDFPNAQTFGAEYEEISIKGNELLGAIENTQFACGVDELRPVMTSVHIDCKDERVTFVASDGHKLVKLNSNNARTKSEQSLNLPSKTANILKDALRKETELLTIKFDTSHAQFVVGDFTIRVRSIEGRYPNYNSVIPQSSSRSLCVHRDTLIAMIKRVSIYANKSSNLVKLAFSQGKLEVFSQDIDFSTSAQEETEVNWNDGDFAIGFKAPFLIELLESIQSDEVLIEMNDPTKATLFKPALASEEFEQVCLLMPMLLQD